MQRAGTLRYMGPPRPVPLLNRPRGDKCSKQGKPSQANRGPKNLGRSDGRSDRARPPWCGVPGGRGAQQTQNLLVIPVTCWSAFRTVAISSPISNPRRQAIPSKRAARSAFLSGFASGPLEYLINLASFCQNAIHYKL
jgi:hypothetical protein